MSVWDWFWAFHREAHVTGNQEHDRLVHYFIDSRALKETAPDQHLAALEEGRLLAQRLRLPRMELFYEHWKLQCLMFQERDYSRCIELSVRATVAVRKPKYYDFPQRICLHEDLINAYVGIDPEGNAELIESALAYMRHEVTSDLDCRFCVQSLQIEFNLMMGRTVQARNFAERMAAASASDSDDFNLLEAYMHLCAIAFVQGELRELAKYGAAAEEVARRRNAIRHLSTSLLWQAVAERKQGNDLEAARYYRSAQTTARRSNAVLPTPYFAAWCAFHESVGELEKAYAVREAQLKTLVGKGQVRTECHCRLQQCKLLAQLGRPYDEELKAARAVAQSLKQPAKYLDQLQSIERGSWDISDLSSVY